MNKIPEKGGTELIVYQIGELKNAFSVFISQQGDFQIKVDKRVSALEVWQIEMKTKALTEAGIFGNLTFARVVSVIISVLFGALVTYIVEGGKF